MIQRLSRYKIASIPVLFFAVVLCSIFFSIFIKYSYATIVDGEDAIDLIGQYTDTSTLTPSYTNSSLNNGILAFGLASSTGMVIDTVDHRLFVSDTGLHRVLVFNLNDSNQLVDKIPDNVIGQSTFLAGSAANSQSRLNSPQGLAYDSVNKRLFVAESGGNRVKVYDITPGITNGMNASYVLGQSTFTSATPANSQSGLNNPDGLAYDSVNQRLFVAEASGNRVKVFDVTSASTGMNASGVLGQAGYTTATAGNTQAGLNRPQGLAYDSVNQYLYVAESTGNRVKIFDVASITNGESAVHILGQLNYNTSTAGNGNLELNNPQGLAFDAVGERLFVAESSGHRVKIFDVASITDGENAFFAIGQSDFLSATSSNTQSGFVAPHGLAYDSTNNRLFVSEPTSNRVKVFNTLDMISPDSSIDTTAYAFSGASYTTIDTTNHQLFVSDTSNNRVLVFNLNESNELVDSTPDYVLGQSNFVDTSAANTQSGLNGPTGIVVSTQFSSRFLYVAESGGNRVKVYDITSGITNGMNASNILGQSTFTGATAGNTQSGLNNPQGLAMNSDVANFSYKLNVAEFGGNRVKIFDVVSITNGENAVGIFGQSDYTGSTAANTLTGLNGPTALAYDSAGARLFVSESTGNRVRILYSTSCCTYNSSLGVDVLGQSAYAGTAAADTQSGLNNPQGLAYDSVNQRLFVAEQTGNRVKIFDVASTTNAENAIGVIGQPTFTSATAGSDALGLSNPQGLAYNETSGSLFVTESTEDVIKTFTVPTQTPVNAIDVIGQYTELVNFTPSYTKSGLYGAPFPHGLYAPSFVEIDSVNHRLFLSDSTNNRVLVFNLNESNELVDKTPDYVLGQSDFLTSTGTSTQSGLIDPRGLAYDSVNNRLFVAEGTNANRIKVFNVTTITNGMNASNILGQSTFTGATPANTQSGLSTPLGLAYDSSNERLFVAESGGHRVKIFDVASITDGENAVNVIGQTTFTGASSGSTQSTLHTPRGLLYDSATSRLYIAEAGGHRVKVFDVASITDGENAINVLGQSTFTGASSAHTQSGLSSPLGLAYDSTNQLLFVAEATGHRVKIFDISDGITDGMNASNVLGQTDFVTASAGSTQSKLSGPYGLAYDTTNKRLFVTESSGHRVKVFDVNPLDINAPVISSVASSTFPTSAVITWTTDESATSTLQYGTTISYGFATSSDSATTSHSYTLEGLSSDTTYHFQISVGDSSGNATTSEDMQFTTTDEDAPIISSVSDTSSSTSTVITWTTNELASSRVVYSADESYASTTDESDTSPRVLSHTVNIADLASCVEYNFKVVSADATGNTSTSTAGTFTTLGCVGGVTPLAVESVQVTTSAGDSASLDSSGNTFSVTVPPNFTATSSLSVLQIKTLSGTGVLTSIGKPASDLTLVGSTVFAANIIIDSQIILDTFDLPLTIAYTYSDADIVGLDESTLKLYHYHDGAWEQLSGCSTNTATNTITCTTTSFSIFALFGSAPVAQAESSSSSHIATRTGGSTTYYGCRDTRASNYESWAAHKQELCQYSTASAGQTGVTQMNTTQTAGAGTTSTIVSNISTSNSSFTRNLTLDMKGSDVGELQKILINLKIGPLAQKLATYGATNYFGPVTRSALVEYQAYYNIKPSLGYFGPLTRAFMQKMSK